MKWTGLKLLPGKQFWHPSFLKKMLVLIASPGEEAAGPGGAYYYRKKLGRHRQTGGLYRNFQVNIGRKISEKY